MIALRRHWATQSEERLRVCPAWAEHDLVFANQVGRPLSPQNPPRCDFYPLTTFAGVPRVPFFSLRHTAATLLHGEGVHPKIVSEMLGHAQTAITLNLYSHVSPTMQSAAAVDLDGLLGCEVGCQDTPPQDESTGQPS